jgi:hypothetical protein
MFFGGFLPSLIKLGPEKRYSHLAVGWNKSQITALIKLRPKKKVQSSGHWLQCRIVLAGLSLCFLAGSLIKLHITTGKKVQLSGHQLECLLRTLTYYTLVDRPSAMMPWGIYPGRKIPALTWGLLVPSTRRSLRKDTMVDGWLPRRCRPSYSSIAYTICNTRNILFLLCLYLERGNKLNVGIVWFEHPHKHLKHASPWWSRLLAQEAWPCSPVATPLLHLLRCASVLLVGCCVIFIRRWPSKATTYFCSHFFSVNLPLQGKRQHPPPTFHPGRLSSSMPLPPLMPTFGWLLCPPIKRQPSKAKGPPISLFFSSINIPPQTTGNRPPHTFRPGLASSPTHPLTLTLSSI